MALLVGILFNVPVRPKKGEDADYLAEVNVLDQVKAVEEALVRLGFNYQLFPLRDDIGEIIKSLRAHKPDVVINLSEGYMGDSSLEMHAASILEMLRIPYTGSTPLTLGLCQDKGLAKDVLRANGIPTPKYRVMKVFEPPEGLSFPLIVKPLREDASIGITKDSFVRNLAELERQVKYVISTYEQPALVEEYISGREFNVSILGNDELVVLPISEIVFEYDEDPKIVGYKAKWFKDSEEYVKTKPLCPAKIDAPLKSTIEEIAIRAYRALKCRDYARIDVRLDARTGMPYVLEVNPNPDISPDSGFVRSLRAARISFEEFVEMIISFALKRAKQNPRQH
ncbi:MAG: ATP-grasp domain-containing protein [Candidatus Nezhaarchaeales archaeon]|nr:MAG: D-alanine--D-alanine ligase [Candidatus Nezhaarchaeota archaeon WYZ-LMO8]TDA35877.1 MAG: D-alanine--D-alanine ligase [Candidatus Nezhaarchaeota archaeon WYZ-LMO7]